MRILNRSGVLVHYELKAGPLRMTMSTAFLEDGEDEEWDSPYRQHQVDGACELHVIVDDLPHVLEADERDTVVIEAADGGGVALRRIPG
ncbi:MAG: hypothetical protein H6732_19145 [Alphaproteobacteria bacterium]|nr:hypothetical protein [Alphaproteobacteria bacterium]